MDKTALINYIKDLQLDRRLENFLVDHIEESEMDQDLLDRVAEMIDIRAEQYKLKGEMFDRLAEEAEELQARTEESEAKFTDQADDLMDKFLAEVEEITKGGEPAEAVDTGLAAETAVTTSEAAESDEIKDPVAVVSKTEEKSEEDWMPKPSPYSGGIGVNPASASSVKQTPGVEATKPAEQKVDNPLPETADVAVETDSNIQDEINSLAGAAKAEDVAGSNVPTSPSPITPVEVTAPSMPGSPAVVSTPAPASTSNGWDASAWYNQNKGNI